MEQNFIVWNKTLLYGTKLYYMEQNFIIWNKTLLYGTVTYIHYCITSPHIFHPHLGTCRTVTLVFVVPLQRTVPSSYAASQSVSCFGTHRAQNLR